MTNKVKELLNERIENTYVSLDDVLNDGKVAGYDNVETGYINGQYCKLVATGHELSKAQIKNFWAYVDESLKLSDWIFLVGAQVRFDVASRNTAIDKLLENDTSKIVDGVKYNMVHCNIIVDTLKDGAESWKEAIDMALASGVATQEEIDELFEKKKLAETYKTPNRNSYQLLMEKYAEEM